MFEQIFSLFLYGIALGGIYALFGAGLSLIYGVQDLANFAQGSFLMLGAYIAYFTINLLTHEPLTAILISFLLIFALGIIIDILLLDRIRKTSGERWLVPGFIVTTGIMLIFDQLAFLGFGGQYRNVREFYPMILSIGGIRITFDRIFILIFTLCVFIALEVFIYKTKLGRAIRAVALNRDAANLMGINVSRIYAITFGLGVGLAAIAGSLILPIFSIYHKIGDETLTSAFSVVILGGCGSMVGALIGGLILGLLEAFTTYYIGSGLAKIFFFLLIIIVLMIRPTGMFGRRPA